LNDELALLEGVTVGGHTLTKNALQVASFNNFPCKKKKAHCNPQTDASYKTVAIRKLDKPRFGTSNDFRLTIQLNLKSKLAAMAMRAIIKVILNDSFLWPARKVLKKLSLPFYNKHF
jgi:hypothetical protein